MRGINLFLLIAIAVLSNGCAIYGVGSKTRGASSSDEAIVVSASNELASIQFYRGGWPAPLDQPNWSHDLTVLMSDPNNYEATGKTVDPLCSKSAKITWTQYTEIKALLAAMQTVPSTGPTLMDAGEEWVEITYKSGATEKYYLMDLAVPAGELFVTNGTELSDYLKALDANLPIACP